MTSLDDDQMLTFGSDDMWGVQYNSLSREFEIVHNPYGDISRRNIRIEADENGDKGDVYIDDSLIVKNEVEVSDGTVDDPSYTFANQNNIGFWRTGTRGLGVTTGGIEAARFDDGHLRVAGDISTTRNGLFGSRETIWDSKAGHVTRLPSTAVTASGDASARRFRLSHPFDSAPRHVSVTPTSEGATGDFWVSDKTDSVVEVTYSAPPPAGEGNLQFDIVASL